MNENRFKSFKINNIPYRCVNNTLWEVLKKNVNEDNSAENS